MDMEEAEPVLRQGAKTTIDYNRPIVVTESFPYQLELVSSAYLNIRVTSLCLCYHGFILDNDRGGQSIRTYPEPWESHW
jgi:hypothetical protein